MKNPFEILGVKDIQSIEQIEEEVKLRLKKLEELRDVFEDTIKENSQLKIKYVGKISQLTNLTLEEELSNRFAIGTLNKEMINKSELRYLISQIQTSDKFFPCGYIVLFLR